MYPKQLYCSIERSKQIIGVCKINTKPGIDCEHFQLTTFTASDDEENGKQKFCHLLYKWKCTIVVFGNKLASSRIGLIGILDCLCNYFVLNFN